MSVLKKLWTNIVRFAKALEGMDDPMGEYMFSVAMRFDKIERDLEHLKKPHQHDSA